MKKETFILKNHNNQQKEIEINATLEIKEKNIRTHFEITGEIENYLFDEQETEKREDELWKRTCFELFIANNKSSQYYELNLSPSTEWNFYTFDDYKKNMREERSISLPSISFHHNKESYSISVIFDLKKELLDSISFNLAVILLDKNNIRHFYSINRKDGQVDFHDRVYWSLKQ
jgi:hypothetical protein